jgi:hypothetical protein
VTTDGDFGIGRETALFQVPFPQGTGVTVNIPYDAARDGSRFLVSAIPATVGPGATSIGSPITVVLNWPTRLRAPVVHRP